MINCCTSAKMPFVVKYKINCNNNNNNNLELRELRKEEKKRN